ncbi:MAG: S9 family peptidase [Thermostichales cyanobacterium DRC_bins_46]
MPVPRPYGTWPSPITAAQVAQAGLRLGQLLWDPPYLYWTEGRPWEQGRSVLMRWHGSGSPEEVLPSGFSVRSRVHEYGGGAFAVAEGQVVFSQDADQRLYRFSEQDPEPLPLTPLGCRYGDGCLHGGYWIGIREDHRGPEVVNTLVRVALDGSDQTGGGQILQDGHDFFSSPRLSPQGDLAWISWDHPAMPWDSSYLWVAGYDPISGSLSSVRLIAGGPEESVQQPRWTASGQLCFLSDRSGWWNLYAWDPEGGVRCLYECEGEFGVPPWVFGQSTYCLLSERELLASYSQNGFAHLIRLDWVTGQVTPIEMAETGLEQLQGSGNQVFCLGGSPTQPWRLLALDLETGAWQVWRAAESLGVGASYCALPRSVAFPSAGGRTAYGYYYPPTHPEYEGLPGERPPLLVKTHGGPTAAASPVLQWGIQYWTSRGWAVFDVNYGGSSGYGRAYRQLLRGQWGIVDAEDVVYGCRWLVEQGLADPERLVISGGSAGGYTTLVVLTFYGEFRAGASYYGIGDLETLARDTHKFEAHYLDSLVGPYPAAEEIYRQRSPIHHVDKLSCPVIFFQGLEDRVVPPNQAEAMVAALQAKGIPVRYVTFAGEGHGFRQGSTIQTCLEAELEFYRQVLGMGESS